MSTSPTLRQLTVSDSDESIFTSRAPETIFQSMSEDRKYHILDLGPPIQENVIFFSQRNTKHYIDNLQGSMDLTADSISGSGDASHQLSVEEFERFLPYSNDVRFDVILLWDLPNYLSEKSIEALIKHLGKFCRRGALLYFLVYSQKEMPIHPARMHFEDIDHLYYQPQLPIKEHSPRYSPKQLEKLLTGFTIYRLFLLGNGLQEHVFRFEKPLDRPNLTILGNT